MKPTCPRCKQNDRVRPYEDDFLCERCEQEIAALQPVRQTMISTKGEITIAGLTPEELEHMQAMLLGTCWVRNGRGPLQRLQVVQAHQPLPPLTADTLITPHFAGDREVDVQGYPDLSRVRNVKELDFDKISDLTSSLIIQGLTAGLTRRQRAYGMYTTYAQRLEGYGFECLRSRRGRNGKFWEIWLLPYLEAAEGDLKKAINEKPGDLLQRLRAAINFLAHGEISFGALDVCCRRLAITYD